MCHYGNIVCVEKEFRLGRGRGRVEEVVNEEREEEGDSTAPWGTLRVIVRGEERDASTCTKRQRSEIKE